MADQQPPKRKVGIYDRPEEQPGHRRKRNSLLIGLGIAVVVVLALLLLWRPAAGASSELAQTPHLPPAAAQAGAATATPAPAQEQPWEINACR